METTFCFHKKHCTFLFYELYFHEQLGVLTEKVKKMFAKELVFIRDLQRLRQRASESVRVPDVVEAPRSMTDLFNNLLHSLFPLVLTFIVNVPQSSEPLLG